MKSYDSFAEWNKDQSAENRKLIGRLERLIKKTAPHLTTTVKWGQGCWLNGATPAIYIHAEDDHVQLGFYHGATLNDPEKLLAGKGKYVRHVKIRSAKDITDDCTDLIAQAAE